MFKLPNFQKKKTNLFSCLNYNNNNIKTLTKKTKYIFNYATITIKKCQKKTIKIFKN